MAWNHVPGTWYRHASVIYGARIIKQKAATVCGQAASVCGHPNAHGHAKSHLLLDRVPGSDELSTSRFRGMNDRFAKKIRAKEENLPKRS